MKRSSKIVPFTFHVKCEQPKQTLILRGHWKQRALNLFLKLDQSQITGSCFFLQTGTWAKAQQSDSPWKPWNNCSWSRRNNWVPVSPWMLMQPCALEVMGAGQKLRDQRVSRLLVRVGIIGGGIWREPKRPPLSKSLLLIWNPTMKAFFLFVFWEGCGG